MIDHLYRSQCNDAYWHGVFGGLYLNHLREAAYSNLLRAERGGQLNGRVYQLRFRADDGQGGACMGTVSVSVPASGRPRWFAIEDL